MLSKLLSWILTSLIIQLPMLTLAFHVLLVHGDLLTPPSGVFITHASKLDNVHTLES